MSRTEFGLARTTCACAECATFCQHMPGFLVPSDLARVASVTPDLDRWARAHLRASPGALVWSRERGAFRIRTLVPASVAGGACHWFSEEGLCDVHESAPFGCAFADAHQSAEEGQRASRAGLMAVHEAWLRRDQYAQVWTMLYAARLRAESPEERRAAMRKGGK